MKKKIKLHCIRKQIEHILKKKNSILNLMASHE